MTHSLFVRSFFVLFALLAVGCDSLGVRVDDERSFSTELDARPLLDQPTALGVLALVNDPATSVAFLDEGLGLDPRAAERIVAHRQGPDGEDGSFDDDRFGTLGELDGISFVAETALLALGDAAWELGYVPAIVLEGVVFNVEAADEVFALVHAVSVAQLDDEAGLDSRAAHAIVGGRPYASLAEVAEQPHVGPATLEALIAYSQVWVQGAE